MIALLILLIFLAACSGGGSGGNSGNSGNAAEELALEIRAEYLEMAACTASMDITADYGQRVYQYGVDLSYTREGETVLTVTAPENIAGVTARLEQNQTALEYDGVRIETGSLTTDGLSPIDAVPALLTAAREGFLAECVLEDMEDAETLHVSCRDPEATPGQGVETQLWFDAATHALIRGEITQDGFTVIQCVFSDFAITN